MIEAEQIRWKRMFKRLMKSSSPAQGAFEKRPVVPDLV